MTQVNSEAKALEETIDELQKEKENLKSDLVQMEDNCVSRNKSFVENEHRVKHELSLFAHISNINWTTNKKDASELQGKLGCALARKRFMILFSFPFLCACTNQNVLVCSFVPRVRAGVISKTNKGDLNTFSFDTRKMSKYQIANKLWDAMEE